MKHEIKLNTAYKYLDMESIFNTHRAHKSMYITELWVLSGLFLLFYSEVFHGLGSLKDGNLMK